MKHLIIFTIAVVMASCQTVKAAAFNPEVTQANLQQTVCNYDIDGKGTNWVSAQRPPVSYTQAWERSVGGTTATVVDHIAPICAGGNPTDYKNYQLQKTLDSYAKDNTERLVCKLLCNGTLTLKQAQGMFWQ